MHRTTRPVLVAAAVGALLLGAGCSSATPGAPAPASNAAAPTTAASAADATGWIDNVCGSLQNFTSVASTTPNIDTSSPAASVKGFSDYLGKVIAAVDSAQTGLKSAGPSPVASGDEAVTKLSTALATYRDKFQQAKTNLEKANPNDQAALAAAVQPLAELKDAPNPTEGLQSSPELEEAAKNAPKCQAIAKLGSAATTKAGG